MCDRSTEKQKHTLLPYSFPFSPSTLFTLTLHNFFLQIKHTQTHKWYDKTHTAKNKCDECVKKNVNNGDKTQAQGEGAREGVCVTDAPMQPAKTKWHGIGFISDPEPQPDRDIDRSWFENLNAHTKHITECAHAHTLTHYLPFS